MADASHDRSLGAPTEPENSGAASRWLPLLYDELRRLAQARLAHERPGQTLQATALVHEAYLRLAGDQRFDDRRHFLAAAAEAMRRILIENARRKGRQKRGGERLRLELLDQVESLADDADLLLSLDELLPRLAAIDPAAAQIARLRLFGGFSIDEAAEITQMSRAVAFREWKYARAWLRAALEPACGGADPAPAAGVESSAEGTAPPTT